MDTSLYEAEPLIIERLEKRVLPSFDLRGVISDVSLADVQQGQLPAPCLLVISMPMQIKQSDDCGVIVEPQWLVAAVTKNYNDRRALNARDEAGELALAAVRHLIGWAPIAGASKLKLRRVPQRYGTQSRLIVPFIVGAADSIDAIP